MPVRDLWKEPPSADEVLDIEETVRWAMTSGVELEVDAATATAARAIVKRLEEAGTPSGGGFCITVVDDAN